jgi:uncharacterized membrane protein
VVLLDSQFFRLGVFLLLIEIQFAISALLRKWHFCRWIHSSYRMNKTKAVKKNAKLGKNKSNKTKTKCLPEKMNSA